MGSGPRSDQPAGAALNARKASFAPVVDGNICILILGSLPGEASLAAGQYYANPRNQFWRLVGGVIGRDPASLDYDTRLAMLLDHGIGLWDAIGTATRTGILDTEFRAFEAKSVADLVMAIPQLRAVAFNGTKAAAIGQPQLAGIEPVELVRLPSSSPAHAALSFDEKLAHWISLRKFLL